MAMIFKEPCIAMPAQARGATLLVLAIALPFAPAARPMLDDAHDRVQTTLDPMMDRIGTLSPRSVQETGPSRLAVGCEMLPRGYGDFENIKEYLPPLGIARVRLHAAWAKLEPQRGKWDFEWLDRQVNWLVENGMEPILETSYGNPVYPGAGGASLSDGMPSGEEALAAWDCYVDALAPVWIDLVTGAIYRIPERMVIGDHRGRKGTLFEGIPYYDAPVVVTERALVMKAVEPNDVSRKASRKERQ